MSARLELEAAHAGNTTEVMEEGAGNGSHAASCSGTDKEGTETGDAPYEQEEQFTCARSAAHLPDEVLDHLLTFVLPYGDMRSCRLVSRAWYHAVKRVEAKLRRLLPRALEEFSVSWFHYDAPSTSVPPLQPPHRVITRRCAHSAAMLGGDMYVFGGCSSRMTSFNDLWRLDLGSLEWQRPPALGCYPSPKAYATMVTYKHKLVLFGGWTQAAAYPLHPSWKLFDECHVYDSRENSWELVRGVTESAPERPGAPSVPRWPPKMARHAASVHGHQMVVVGGLQHHTGSGRFAPSAEVWVLDLESERWRLQRCSRSGPSPRYGHSQLALDDRHMLLLGGQYPELPAGGSGGPNQLRQDAWLLELAAPDDEWRWRRLTVEGGEHAPSHLWCHPACLVESQALVLTCPPCEVPVFGRPPQVAQGNVHPVPPPPPPERAAAAPPTGERRGVAAGPGPGRSGGAGPRRPGAGPETGQLARRGPPPSAAELPPPPPVPAGRPSVRPNARALPELRLAGLERMQRRLEAAAAERAAPRPRPRARRALTAGYRLVSASGRRMLMHVLETSGAVSEGVVRWRSRVQHDSPEERILYSLLAARGELVMFGGIVPPPNDEGGDERNAYNALSFLTVPAHMFH